MELLIHSQISTVQPLKFGNGQVILSHTLLCSLGMWSRIHTQIELIHVSKRDPDLINCVGPHSTVVTIENQELSWCQLYHLIGSNKCQLCHHFMATMNVISCYHQWWQSWHHDDFIFNRKEADFTVIFNWEASHIKKPWKQTWARICLNLHIESCGEVYFRVVHLAVAFLPQIRQVQVFWPELPYIWAHRAATRKHSR